MHYQNPPLIHRDLKVENILLSPPQTYKLCDFGSTTTPLPREKVPTAVEAIQKMELEINKTTTLQYRAPELVDVWGRKGFDEKIGEGLLPAPRWEMGELELTLHSVGDGRYLGAGSIALQALLLHHAIRGAWPSRHPQRAIQGEFVGVPTRPQRTRADASPVRQIPPYPAYSNSIKGLIGAMLQESASQRPNIYQVHEQVCRLRGVAVRLENVSPTG